jgi:hypothetical protein
MASWDHALYYASAGGQPDFPERKETSAMAILDPWEERKRLAESYSRMADGELEKIAEDSASLTSLARQVLNDEMIRRGLGGVEQNPPPAQTADPVEYRKLVTIRKFRDLHEAWLAKGSLESAGIECFLVDDNMVRLDWFYSNLVGGVKLQVRAEDYHAALRLWIDLSEDTEADGAEQ